MFEDDEEDLFTSDVAVSSRDEVPTEVLALNDLYRAVMVLESLGVKLSDHVKELDELCGRINRLADYAAGIDE